MKNTRKIFGLTAVAGLALLISLPAGAQGYGYGFGHGGMEGAKHRTYLGFSLGDGAYINYRCSGGSSCESTIVAPLDFEMLLGFQIVKNVYLDLAVNWAVDYYQGYYNEVTYVAGVRPGMRFYLPALLNRHLYFRVAVPFQYTLDDANRLLVGLLLGVGIEWRMGNMAVFLEADVVPHFREVYPGYYAIPTRGRGGIALLF